MTRRILSVTSILAVIAGLGACGGQGQSDEPSTPEPVGTATNKIVTGPMGPAFWPTAPITWAGGVGTWPIAVWSPSALNWAAFSIPGVTNLGLSLTAMDGTIIPNFAASAVSASIATQLTAGPWLGGLTPYYGMMPWMYGLNNVPYYGTPGSVYGLGFYPSLTAGCATGACDPTVGGLLYPGLSPAGLTLADPTGLLGTSALLPGFNMLTPFASPILAQNALWFSSFPAFAASTPLLVNLTFSGLDAMSMQMASLNIFSSTVATTAATSAALQATTFPILGIPLDLGL